ncbi:MAG: NADH-quinone oxidoreductase subunit N [Anaerolineales bacterium]|nr:NADH-quinone oxidoreductase subunit N [Anaerolineales bacterium]
MTVYDSTTILAILPEILILGLGIVLLVLEPFWKEAQRRSLGWLVAGGLLVTLVVSLIWARPVEAVTVFGGMLRSDWMSFLFKMLFLLSAALTALFMMDVEKLGRRGEAYLLLLVATLGMNLMAAASDLVMLYLAIETTSIPLYVLAGFMLDDDKSTESGFKYLLFGAAASTIMLYGFSLLYGFSGSTSLAHFSGDTGLGLGLILLVVVGLGFKVSIAPFHFWAPDTYEGAPTPVAGFLSTASKAAGFAVLLRLFLTVFDGPVLEANWSLLLSVLAAITMTVGNLIALKQTNIKRLLAYSSIAHAGYAMIGMAAAPAIFDSPNLGVTSVVYYLLAYILTNLAAFGVVAAFGRVSGSDEIQSYAGLSRRSPALGLVMLAAFLSLSGMPPFAGFVAKVFVFAAAIQAGLVWLAVIGILNSIVGLYYYLNVLKVVYLYRSDDDEKPVPAPAPYWVALIVLLIGIILVGTVLVPWFNMAGGAALNLF